jgi:hypothetical protein
VSVEGPARGPSVASSESSHGGPELPWGTILETCDGTLSRGELAGELVERGYAEVQPAAVDIIDAAIARGELESDGRVVVASSRQINLNKSVNSATAENPVSENRGVKGRPSIEEKVAEFAAEYPVRVTEPLAEFDGVSLRRDYAEIETKEWVEDQPDIPELGAKPAAKGETVTDVSAIEWGEAVRTLLEKYERTKQTSVNLEKGRPGDVEYAEFSVSAENRWFASYQEKYFAQLDAWLRELCGGERPSGGETEASFENPRIALITRSASSVPNGERVGVVDHAEQLQESWSDVYHAMRNTLRSEGYEMVESWQYDRRLEPHTGKRGNDSGTNECYAHEHIILVVDGDVEEADLRPIVEKHVESCEWAGAEAHGEEAIEVREPSELNNPAAYVADYCSIDPVELWEREPAYVAWAAGMDAGNIRTVSRSEAAREAAKADACRQRAESAKAEQSETHGESVRRVGGEIVCSNCDCSHDIDQSQTLTAHRTDGPTVAADGGIEVPDREEEVREQWPNAEEAAVVGESPERHKQRKAVRRWLESEKSIGEFWATETEDVRPPGDVDQLVAEVEHPEYDPSEVVGFDDSVPTWHVKSVTVDGEERPASAGNGIDMVEVTNVQQRLVDGLDIGPEKYRCECGVAAYASTIVTHLRTHGIKEPEIAAELVEMESV